MALAIVGVFLLPSTIAIYAAVNGTAWDLLDLQLPPLLESLTAAAALFGAAVAGWQVLFSALGPEVTRPLHASVPLFELDCALIR